MEQDLELLVKQLKEENAKLKQELRDVEAVFVSKDKFTSELPLNVDDDALYQDFVQWFKQANKWYIIMIHHNRITDALIKEWKQYTNRKQKTSE